ncbi:MAG TPA: type II CAAX endopeptidase family protein [Caulobacteraceae bacterium]|jgi:membrane protease YdiL (CAAX protease family)|nr:type II CAAX endopeptidase family protein [Caulobacteraceae bacterium]
MTAQKQTRGIILFLALTVALSAGWWALVISAKSLDAGGGAYVSALMWSPGIAAILTTALLKLDWRALGFGWGGGRWPFLAYLIPLAYAAVAYGFIWAVGFGAFPDPKAVATASKQLGWSFDQPTFLVIFFLLSGTVALVGCTASALGEEIGWRGFLAPRFVGKFGFTRGALATGAIWSAWHYPLILGAHYNNGAPWWFSIVCFTVLVIAMSVILTWIRLRTNSVWPCAILHGSHNLFIQVFFTPFTAKTGPLTKYAIDEFGVAVPVVAALFAIGFWLARKQAVSVYNPECSAAG